MTGLSPPPVDPPALDPPPADLDRDDALLGALGRGEAAADGDRVTAMLAAWRADVAGPATLVRSAVPAPDPAGTGIDTAAGPTPAAGPITAVGPAAARRPASAGGPTPSRRSMPGRRPGATRRRLAVAAAVVVLAGGGTAAAAATTTPHSPLWPITRLLYPQRAERVGAEDSLEQARQAISQGRRGDAQQLLDQADAQISRVTDAGDRARLRTELDALRNLLLSTVTGPGPAAPGTASNPPSGAPPATGGPAPSPGPLLPSLLPPTLVPPSLVPPLPTGVLPTSLLPTGLLPTSLLPLPGLGH